MGMGQKQLEIDIEELKYLRYTKKMKLRELAEHFNCSEWTIKDRLKEKPKVKNYNYYVYIVTNNVNGKKYIGKRRCTCAISEDKYMGSGLILKKAMKKHGKENFTKEIIEVCATEDEAYDREIYWISYYNAAYSEEFYNISEGGCGVTGEINTYGKPVLRISPLTGEVEREYKSITEAHRELGLFEYTNTLNNICRRKVGLAYKCLWLYKEDYEKMQDEGTYTKWFDKVHNRYLLKYNQSIIKKKLLEEKPVVQLDKRTLEVICEYPNVDSAAQSINVQRMYLLRACEGKCTNLKGYSWLYKSLYEKLSREEIFNIVTRKADGRKRVKCVNTGFIFDSIAAAKKWVGCDARINDVLSGKGKTAGTHPETGEPLLWVEVELNDEPEEEMLEKRKLLCLTTNEEFDKVADALRKYHLPEGLSSSVSKAARGIRDTAGKHPETGEPLKWKYVVKSICNEQEIE